MKRLLGVLCSLVSAQRPRPVLPSRSASSPRAHDEIRHAVLGPAEGRLNTELSRILRDADVKKRFAVLGVDTATMAPDEFGKFIRAEADKYAKLIQQIGIPKQ